MTSSQKREELFRSLADCYQLPVSEVVKKLEVSLNSLTYSLTTLLLPI